MSSWTDTPRPCQVEPPGDWWRTWVFRGGRGAGKNFAGARAVIGWVRPWGQAVSNGIVVAGYDEDSVMKSMVHGPSGILAMSPHGHKPRIVGNQLRWANGSVADLRFGDEPSGFLGVEGNRSWLNDFAQWTDIFAQPTAQSCWDHLRMGMRHSDPRTVITTTGTSDLIRTIEAYSTTVVTTSSTMENAANLDPAWLAAVTSRHAGSPELRGAP